MDCIHRNGRIISYEILYEEEGSGNAISIVSIVATNNEVTLSNLMPSTTYSIQVAAATSAGIGPYSDSIQVTTLCELYYPMRYRLSIKLPASKTSIYSGND